MTATFTWFGERYTKVNQRHLMVLGVNSAPVLLDWRAGISWSSWGNCC